MRIAPLRRYRGRLNFLFDVLQDKPLSVLDVGNLGDGTSTNMTIKNYVEQHGGTYYGLDSNAELTKKLNLPNQLVGDLHGTDIESDKFDVIYGGEIIEHTWHPGDMVAECFRLLKPQGLLIFDTPNPYSIASILRYFFQRKDSMGDVRRLTYEEAKDNFKNMTEKGAELKQPQHKIFFTPAMLKQLLETHGFKITSVGFTQKPHSVVERILMPLFPQGGNHLCMVGQKSTLDEIYSDI